MNKRQKWDPTKFYSPCYFINIYKNCLGKFGTQKVLHGSRFLPEREAFATSALALAISDQDKNKYLVKVNQVENDEVDTIVGYLIGKEFINIEVQVLEFTKYSADIYEEIKKKLRKRYTERVTFCVFINREGKIPSIKKLHDRLSNEVLMSIQKNRQIWFIARTSQNIHTAYLVHPKMWYNDINLEDICSKENSVYGITPIEIPY